MESSFLRCREVKYLFCSCNNGTFGLVNAKQGKNIAATIKATRDKNVCIATDDFVHMENSFLVGSMVMEMREKG